MALFTEISERPEIVGHWTIPTPELPVHMGIHPVALPPGSFFVAGGIDGDHEGAAIRLAGMRLLVNVPALAELGSASTHWEDWGVHQLWPFRIRQTNGDHDVYGFLMWNRQTEKVYTLAFVEGTTDLSDPHAPVNAVDATLTQTVTGGGDETFAGGLTAVVARGRYLYMYAAEAGKNRTLWWDWDRWSLGGNNGKINQQGWVFDYLGIPDTSTSVEVYGGLTDAEIAYAGITLAPSPPNTTLNCVASVAGAQLPGAITVTCHFYKNGEDVAFRSQTCVWGAPTWSTTLLAANWPTDAWMLSVRFEDDAGNFYPQNVVGLPRFHRDYTTQLSGVMLAGGYALGVTIFDPERNRETGLAKVIHYVTAGQTQEWIPAAADDYYYIELRDAIGAESTPLALDDKTALLLWKKYGSWATPSSGDVDQSPVETLQFTGYNDVCIHWQTVVNGTFLGPHIMFGKGASSSDDAYVDFVSCTDASVGGGTYHDDQADEYRVWDSVSEFNLDGIVAVVVYGGMTWAVQQRDGLFYLLWSDTRDFRLENFPLANEYALDYKSATGLSFAPLGDSLFLFGDGPVYQMARDGIDIAVVERRGHFSPVSREAVCAVDTTAYAVCETGFFMFDGLSGTPIRSRLVDRLLKRRWADPAVRSTLQVAYDEALDVLVIHCAATAQTALLWLGLNRLTVLEGAFYQFVRELSLPDSVGEYRRRVIFFNWHGRFAMLRVPLDSYGTDYTMHDVHDYGSGTVPTKLHAYCYDTSTTTIDDMPVTKLRLKLSPAGAQWTATGHHKNGLTVAFLTGSRRGELHQLWHNDNPAADDDEICIRGTLTDLATSVEGQWLAIDPVPLVVVGAPLIGIDPDRGIYHERKHIGLAGVILTDIEGTDAAQLSEIPTLRVGVCASGALTAGEPAPAPTGYESDPWYYLPDAGPLPRFLDEGHASVVSADVPAAYGAPADLIPTDTQEALAPDDGGATGLVLHPFVISDVAGLRFSLCEMSFRGIISASEKD